MSSLQAHLNTQAFIRGCFRSSELSSNNANWWQTRIVLRNEDLKEIDRYKKSPRPIFRRLYVCERTAACFLASIAGYLKRGTCALFVLASLMQLCPQPYSHDNRGRRLKCPRYLGTCRLGDPLAIQGSKEVNGNLGMRPILTSLSTEPVAV